MASTSAILRLLIYILLPQSLRLATAKHIVNNAMSGKAWRLIKSVTIFFSQHGVRWTELARLPYFDLVRHTIIDLMHNLLLGT